ncbi:unnamed protein product, partial [Owenia fusiformis]
SNNIQQLKKLMMNPERYEKLAAKFPHKISGEHLFRGAMVHGGMLKEGTPEAEAYDNIDLTADDCIIASYAKSGTTWTQEIVWLLYNQVNTDKAKKIELMNRCPFIEVASRIAVIKALEKPKLTKTHVPYNALPKSYHNPESTRPKVVYVARNPKDVAVSFYHFYRSNKSLGNFNRGWEEFFEMFVEGYVGGGSWFDHIIPWYKASVQNPDVLFMKYEDMKRNPIEEIQKIATFLGKDVNDEMLEKIHQHTKFDSMKSNPMVNFTNISVIDHSVSPFMRKGEIGDWKNYFTVSQDERFMKMYNDKMGQIDFDLTFDFE